MLYPPPLFQPSQPAAEPAEMVTWLECANQEMLGPGLTPIKRLEREGEVRMSIEVRQATISSGTEQMLKHE